MRTDEILQELRRRAVRFSTVAHGELGRVETSKSRIRILDKSYAVLKQLSVKQDELFRQAIRCAENGLYRACIVMTWIALMDFLQDKLLEPNLKKIQAVRPKWQCGSVSELIENYGEFQQVEVLKTAGIIDKNAMKGLHSLLHKRNECAHPGPYSPDLNEALGYMSEAFQRIRILS